MNIRNISVASVISAIPGVVVALQLLLAFPLFVPLAQAQTARGEIEQRPAPIALRKCVGGASVGDLCNDDTDCPGSTCFARNVFNISVAVHYDAPNADITTIRNMISDGSAVLFDATDGQAEIGQAVIHNNVMGTKSADLRIFDRTCLSGTSVQSICATDNDCPPNPPDPSPGVCGSRGFSADAGFWKNGSSMFTSIGGILARARPGDSLAHEFTHLVFDARDEYENRPGCVSVTASDECPIAATLAVGEPPSLMDSGFDAAGAVRPRDEYCWGQGDASDPTDLSAGNHDADNTTEQSQCRSNRSIWDQVVWSWPNVFQVPAGGPDAAANGAVVNATKFIVTNDTQRIVLVLDESGSMNKEAPSRIERLKVAARDFVTLAEDGTELGIVSYSDDAAETSGRANVDIDALGADRSDWTDAIDGLTPDNWTNIGAGLQKARDMITTAGGVTGNTYIVLMTDGLNNRPEPQATADADLQAKVNDLLADGVPVYVTCTGSDLGLDAQCAEIATGTGGHYVDSDTAAQLPDAFVGFHERIAGGELIMSAIGRLAKASTHTVFVEQGSEAVAVTLTWDKASASAGMTIVDPEGNTHDSLPMPQGRYFRHANPIPGEWQVRIAVGGDVFVDSDYVLRAFSRNRSVSFAASVSNNNLRTGDAIRVHAFPKSLGGSSVTHPSDTILAKVIRPDGSIDSLVLHDQGRGNSGGGDDVPQDGIFTGIYDNTQLKGAYTFVVRLDANGWSQSLDDLMDSAVPGETPRVYESPRFVREFVLSAAVGAPGDVEPDPEDGPDRTTPGCDGYDAILPVLCFVALVLALLVLWYCCLRSRRG